MGSSGLRVSSFQSSEKMHHGAPSFAALLSALLVHRGVELEASQLLSACRA